MKKIILITILAITFIACSKENTAVKEEVVKAKVLLEKEEFLPAIDVLNKVIETYPKERATIDAKKILEIAKLKKQEKLFLEATDLFEKKNYSSAKKLINSLLQLDVATLVAEKGKKLEKKIVVELLREQTEKLSEITKLFEERKYSLAKEEIASLVKIDETTSLARKGQSIEKEIVEIEEIMNFEKLLKEKKYLSARRLLDSSKISNEKTSEFSKKLDIEVNKELKVLEKRFGKKEDRFSGQVILKHVNAPRYSNEENFVEILFVNNIPFFQVNYFGDNWVFFEEVLIKVDNDPLHTLKMTSRNNRVSAHNGVTEQVSTNLYYGETTLFLMAQIASGKEVNIRFVGSRNSKDFKLKAKHKLGIKESLKYLSLILAKEESSSTRAINFLNLIPLMVLEN